LAAKAKKAKNDIIILSKIGKCTVDKVYSEILKYSPDLVCIDYLSLMETPRNAKSMWEAVTYLTQHLKQLARTLPMPILSVAQTNIGGSTEGAQLDNIAFSRSIGADSDIVIGLGQRDESMRKNHQMKLRLLKNRDGRILETDLFWELETMTIRDWNIADAFRSNSQNNTSPIAPSNDVTEEVQ
jgi:replicative DNA helicase